MFRSGFSTHRQTRGAIATATNFGSPRGEEGHILPLTAAQEALWYTQLALGDTPLTISQYMDISGDLDERALRQAVDTVGRTMGTAVTTIVERDGRPRLCIDDTTPTPMLEIIDLRTNRQPTKTAREQMERWSRAPKPLDSRHLVTAALLRVDDRRWFLFSRAHHIVLDGFGAYVLLVNIARMYRQLVADDQTPGKRKKVRASGRGRTISAIAGQQALLDHQSRYLVSKRFTRDCEYWADICATLPAATTLARKSAPPSADPILVAEQLPSASVNLLSASANRLGCNSTVLLIAALALYVSRASGQPVVALSLPVAARLTGELRQTAGSVSNVLPIVVEVIEDMTVAAYVSQVSSTLTGALRHQSYRHEQMLRDQGAVTAHIAHAGPVVNVFPAQLVVDLGSSLTAEYHVLSTGPVADLNVNIYPSGNAKTPTIDFEANAERYDRATVTQHRDNVIAMLETLCGAVDSSLLGQLSIPVVGPQDGPPPASPVLLRDLLDRHASSAGVAVIDGTSELTHRDLTAAVDKLRHTLRSIGIGPEDRVVSTLPRSLAEVVAFRAVAAVGACYVPVDPQYPPARQQLIIETCRPSLILCTQPFMNHPPGDIGELLLGPHGEHTAEHLATSPTATGPPSSTLVERAAYVIFTSGSTGSPKGVISTSTGLGPLVEHIERTYGLTPDSVVARAASTAFDTSVVEMLAASVTGATLAVIPDGVFGGSEFAHHLTSVGVTHLMTTPAVLATFEPADIPTVTHLIVGGDVCPPDLMRKFAEHASVRCAYGPTETSCSVTMTEAWTRQPLSETSASIGCPMVAVRTHVRDSRLRPTPAGVAGELYISGPALARGYLNDPALSSTRFVADPTSTNGGRMFRTGDRVISRRDGSLDFLGRVDDQVKIRGVRIEPSEIDATLRAAEGVTDSVTVATHHHGSPLLAAYVTTSKHFSISMTRQLLAQQLPSHFIPAAITVLDKMPLTPAGKVDRQALPAPDLSPSAPFRSAVSDDERCVIGAFATATGATTVGADDDFFDIGGDSLSATTLVACLNTERDVTLSVRDIFECRTPARLALRLASAQQVAPLTHRTDEAGPIKLAPAQRNVDIDDRSPANCIPFTLEFADHLDHRALERAISEVIDSHPMMRTRFINGSMVVDPPTYPDAPVTLDGSNRSFDTFLHQPFDLTVDHPIRFGVHHRPTTTLAVAAHHRAIDGWSLSIIARDLITAYLATPNPSRVSATEDAPGATDPVQIDFLDYSLWANTRLGDRHDPTSLAYWQMQFWRSELSDLPAAATLRSDRSRPNPWQREALRERLSLRQYWSDIAGVARSNSVSTTTVLRASLAKVLLTASNDPAIAIATPVSGRTRSHLHNIVGMFVNTVPVVCRRDDVQTAAGLPAVAAAELRAFSHSDIPYVEIAHAISDTESSSAHPLFQVVLSIENSTPTAQIIDAAHQAGVVITARPPDIAKCDLHFAVTTGPEGCIEILYPTSMFDSDTIAYLLDDWLHLIRRWL
ncbi:amino acid adenylation domain-containing protein [Williamsia sp. R60]